MVAGDLDWLRAVANDLVVRGELVVVVLFASSRRRRRDSVLPIRSRALRPTGSMSTF